MVEGSGGLRRVAPEPGGAGHLMQLPASRDLRGREIDSACRRVRCSLGASSHRMQHLPTFDNRVFCVAPRTNAPKNRQTSAKRGNQAPRQAEHRGCSRVISGQGKFRLPYSTPLEATMLKKLMISAAVSALMVSGALAQASPPAMDPPKAAAPKADAAPVDAAKFISSQSTDQWVFSRFKGTDVLGPDNASVGNVNDMLFDKNGKI